MGASTCRRRCSATAPCYWNHFEWWHYQLFEPQRYPLLSDAAAPRRLMAAETPANA
jgi:hypothetical protein